MYLGSEVDQPVRQIRATRCHQAYDKICQDVFLQHASVEGDMESQLPLTSIHGVFERLKIPPEHLSIFETVLRKETNFKRKPEKMLGYFCRRQTCSSYLQGDFFSREFRSISGQKRSQPRIPYDLFHQVLIKVLRRIRDTYCIRIQKG